MHTGEHYVVHAHKCIGLHIDMLLHACVTTEVGATIGGDMAPCLGGMGGNKFRKPIFMNDVF